MLVSGSGRGIGFVICFRILRAANFPTRRHCFMEVVYVPAETKRQLLLGEIDGRLIVRLSLDIFSYSHCFIAKPFTSPVTPFRRVLLKRHYRIEGIDVACSTLKKNADRM